MTTTQHGDKTMTKPLTTFRIVREEEGVEKDSLPLSREQATAALEAVSDCYDPPARANFLQEEDS